MIGFFIKKAFFDGWDNLISLIILNLGYFVAFAFIFFVALPVASLGLSILGLALVAIGIFLFAIWWASCVYALKTVADFSQVAFRELWSNIKKALIPGVQVACMLVVLFAIIAVGLPFYAGQGGIVALLAFGLLIWGTIIFLLALQWFLPMQVAYGGGFRKNLRKCFILFFDNPLFTIFLAIYSFIALLLSVPLAFLMPGFSGVALAHNVAIRIRLYKYDYLEKHPDAKRNNIPWDELLIEDRELVGKRTLKGMIFPWKE